MTNQEIIRTETVAIILENTWLTREINTKSGRLSLDFGWGNGYVLVPESHPYHGIDYNEMGGISVHGGLTFSDITWSTI